MKKIFIGTVGYHNLHNHSIGTALLLPQLQKMNWASVVEVDELNWGPIAIIQKFQSLPTPYDTGLFLLQPLSDRSSKLVSGNLEVGANFIGTMHNSPDLQKM